MKVFMAAISAGPGELTIDVSEGKVPYPVSFELESSLEKFSFAMSKDEAKRLIAELITKL